MLIEHEAIKEILKANAMAVYKDAAQPSVRVIGKSLAQCISLFATPVGRMAEIFEKNIHRYLDKLKGLKEEELVSPDTRVLVPILEKLRFTDDDLVADYYAEILATASKKVHAKKVLVTFIEILDRLTADELRILEYIDSRENKVEIPAITEEESVKYGLPKGANLLDITGSLPVTDIRLETKGQTGYKVLRKNFNLLPELVELNSPENIESYMNNMMSLGLLEKTHRFRFAIDKIYHHLENHRSILELKEKIKSDSSKKVILENGRIDITGLGGKLLELSSRREKNR